MTRDEANKLVQAIVDLRKVATDEQAIAAPAIYPEWQVGKEYKTNDRVRYAEKLYKALADHTSEEAYTPDITNYLWVAITDPSIEFPDWVQPVGYADAYALGAKVSHNGERWISTVDNNTWEPGVYGWDKL